MTTDNHTCVFGPWERSLFAGTPHRKCRVPGCKHFTIDPPEDDDLSRCWNCDRVWGSGELKPVADLFERVSPGDTMPAGECPTCGCLCYPIQEDN